MIVLFLRPNLKEWKRRLRASKSHKSLYLSLTFPNGTRLYYFVSCISRIHVNEQIKDRCNHWLPEFFAKNAFFIWTLSVCMSRISCNLQRQHESMPFIPLPTRFMTLLLAHAQKSKLRESKSRSYFTFVFFALHFSTLIILFYSWAGSRTTVLI